MLFLPGPNILAEQELRDFRAAAENALRLRIGQPVADVPNDLTQLPGVKQPDSVGSFVQGGTLVGDAIAGLGDVVTRGAFLVGIVVLVVMGARMVLSSDGGPSLPTGILSPLDVKRWVRGAA